VVHEVHSAERTDIASRGDEERKLNRADTPRFLVSCVALSEVAATDHIWSRNASATTTAEREGCCAVLSFQGISPVAYHVHANKKQR
jgi:hypothetical protein